MADILHLWLEADFFVRYRKGILALSASLTLAHMSGRLPIISVDILHLDYLVKEHEFGHLLISLIQDGYIAEANQWACP
jgi:hypothetical protein